LCNNYITDKEISNEYSSPSHQYKNKYHVKNNESNVLNLNLKINTNTFTSKLA